MKQSATMAADEILRKWTVVNARERHIKMYLEGMKWRKIADCEEHTNTTG